MLNLSITAFEFQDGNVKRIRCRCNDCSKQFWIDPADHIEETVSDNVNAILRCKGCSEKFSKASDRYHE